VWVYLIFTSSRNRTLICGPSGCSGDCDGHPPGTIICEYDDSCVGSLIASIENPPNGSHFFTGYPITFNGSASGGSKPYTYSWDLGETTMSGKSFTYTYINASDYTVTLTVNDSASNTATDSILLHIHSPAVLFSCFINETCNSPYTPVLGLSAQDNAHAEIISVGGNYTYKLCCVNVSSVQTTTGTCDTLGAGFTGLVTLSGDTNAQVEKYNYTGTDGFEYKKNACVKLVGGSLKCIYDTKANCVSWNYNKYVVSISGSTNAHLGNEDAYSTVLCCKEIS